MEEKLGKIVDDGRIYDLDDIDNIDKLEALLKGLEQKEKDIKSQIDASIAEGGTKMDERQDIEPKDKNIAQLMVKLTTVQAQIKLVKAAIFMNKQRAAIANKMKNVKEYAESQAEKYDQNKEAAQKAIDTYKKSVEEAMGKYENDYLQVMANQDKWQAYELEDISEQKKLATEIKETRKTQEYKDWKQEVKSLNREIKANANNPEKLAVLAEQLKSLQAKDPTLEKQQQIELIQRNRATTKEMLDFYDTELKIIQDDRDKKLDELLENKETSLAKIQKQNVWQKFLARFTSKSKSFNNNVITPIMDKASKIKNEKIPQILADRKEKQDARKEKREETMKKIKRTKDNVVDKIMDTKDSTVGLAKKGIRAVVDFGREAKKATIRTIERAGEVKDNIKEGLRTAVENSTQTLEDLNGER